ncbi:hypothetical protein ES707_10225 [subsurface metagenome]
MEKENMTMAKRAKMKMDLTVNQPMSYSQINDLKRLRSQVKILWQENKELYNFMDKARMYALLTNQEEKWNEFWQANKYKIGYPILKEFFKQLKYQECAYCGNPFPQGRTDNIYCGSTCRVYACRKGLTKNKRLLAKQN